MSEQNELIQLLEQKKPIVALLAPSFPIVYEYPEIVARLKKLGFDYVIEVTAGADRTNQAAVAALKADPKVRLITSPCPSLVRMVRTKFPQLEKHLAFAADSPMIATAKIAKEKYPHCKPIFLGPCNAKKLEANEDYPELNILALNFKQLDEVFTHFNLSESLTDFDPTTKFDINFTHTRLYPISGGLAQSAQVKEILANDELEVVSGWQNCEAALKRFEESDRVRLLDILFCEGGCVNGPGIVSDLNHGQRREKVMKFWGGGKKNLWSKLKNVFAGKFL
ncbi:MAG: [Fe-Fe] hydrogenase large subunit C-terminal domain-containing protein [Patescibacteria group bacterium]